MHIVQHASAPPVDTKVVWYSGTDTLLPGYVLLLDIDYSTPADWDEQVAGRVYAKPVTANLDYAAVIVTETPENAPGWVRVLDPNTSDQFEALVTGTISAGDRLKPTNDEYHFVVVADLVSTEAYHNHTKCRALDAQASGTNNITCIKTGS